jgi:hypothetical protein
LTTTNEVPPEVFADHLRQVNPNDPEAEHYLEVNRMLRVAKVVAKLSLGEDYIPTEVTRGGALLALEQPGRRLPIRATL